MDLGSLRLIRSVDGLRAERSIDWYTEDMEQHPIPRQVTTFEFKLIGFMTLKQFVMVIAFLPVGFLVWFLFPIPYVKVFLGFVVAMIGPALAFIKIQDRSLDIWVKNFFKLINRPTQFLYKKENVNEHLYFLKELYFTSDPHRIMAHIESRDKLAGYLASQKQQQAGSSRRRQHVHTLLQHSNEQLGAKEFRQSTDTDTSHLDKAATPAGNAPRGPQTPHQPAWQKQQTQTASPQQSFKHPFLTGIIKNNRRIPLPGILVYIKDANGNPIRILKTNPHGVFATYNPLPEGSYALEIKDPNGGYFFDTMKIPVKDVNPEPFEFHSRELL